MKYGLLEYTTNNIGDEIQSLSAKQFLPQVDTFVKRDYLHDITSDEKIKIILNGWFTHNPEHWPPSDDIDPLFISFHIAKPAIASLTTPESLSYFKQHEPIGCRDLWTRDILRNHDIEAYFSGCLTLTLSRNLYADSAMESDIPRNGIIFTDLPQHVIHSLPEELQSNATQITHDYQKPPAKADQQLKSLLGNYKQSLRGTWAHEIYAYTRNRINTAQYEQKTYRDEKFSRAETILKRYVNANLVITTRLHATLPCVALGTPVLLVHENPHDPRFSGLKDYINIVSESTLREMSEEEIRKLSTTNDPAQELQSGLAKRAAEFTNQDVSTIKYSK